MCYSNSHRSSLSLFFWSYRLSLVHRILQSIVLNINPMMHINIWVINTSIRVLWATLSIVELLCGRACIIPVIHLLWIFVILWILRVWKYFIVFQGHYELLEVKLFVLYRWVLIYLVHYSIIMIYTRVELFQLFLCHHVTISFTFEKIKVIIIVHENVLGCLGSESLILFLTLKQFRLLSVVYMGVFWEVKLGRLRKWGLILLFWIWIQILIINLIKLFQLNPIFLHPICPCRIHIGFGDFVLINIVS